MTALATSRAGGPGGSSSRASSTAPGPRDAAGPPPRASGLGSVTEEWGAGPAGGSGGSPPRASTALAALATVRDPELDEPITSLGFVTSCTVSAGGYAQVRLRLPTYFCAPNFAFLMVADAYDAVSAVPGVRSTEVVLEDHFASDAINGGVAAQTGFAASFDGEAVSELHGLRADFLRKAVLAGTDQVCRPLLAAGASRASLLTMTLGEVPASGALDRLRLRRARSTRISIEANSSICRGMLRHRYDSAGLGQAPEEERRAQ